MPLPQKQTYTIDYIYSLPEGQRAELIDGQVYDMAPPRRIHQELVGQFTKVIGQYIDVHNGSCKIYPSPFAVFLNADGKNYVEPDISVICDRDKLDEYGCHGAPDWVIEVVSPSTQKMDYGIKLFKYRTANVREYWIVNPMTCVVNVFDFEHDEKTQQYRFQDDIPVCIYPDLTINVAALLT
ncbi:MAG: Uma2 family endonuclease [Lachnospiraceae bacterium]|nr:Uma2 family endonuclease [Lachnospiraceae bacterium]